MYEFFEEARENTKILEKLVGKENSERVLDIILEQKKKRIIIKRIVYLKTLDSEGISHLKKVLDTPKEIEVKYISAGKYSLKIETEDGRKGEQKMKNTLEEIEKKAKEKGMIFEIKEK